MNQKQVFIDIKLLNHRDILTIKKDSHLLNIVVCYSSVIKDARFVLFLGLKFRTTNYETYKLSYNLVRLVS